ncbi:Phospholipase D1 [Mycoblastus sanguinarius]|nr:Phospholipase D1 [Mycoblastus sanguinarius]
MADSSENSSHVSPTTRSPRSQSPRVPQRPQTTPSDLNKLTTYSPLRSEPKLNGNTTRDDLLNPATPPQSKFAHKSTDFPFGNTREANGSGSNGTRSGIPSSREIKSESPGRYSGDVGSQLQDSRVETVNAVTSALPSRPSVQFPRPEINKENRGTAHGRSGSGDFVDGEIPGKDRRGGSLFTKLKALASTSSAQSHARTPSGFTLGGDSVDERIPAANLSPNSERGTPLGGPLGEEDSDLDADAEESTGEDTARDDRNPSGRKRRRKSRRPEDIGTQTAPATPKTPVPRSSRPNFLTSTSLTPSDRFRPSFLPRRATMTDLPGEDRQVVSEDEGRERTGGNNSWRRSSPWAHGRGFSNGGSRKRDQQSSAEERRPSNFRRLTGFGTSSEGPDGSSFSPWKISRGERAQTISAAKWRQLKAGLRMVGQRRKAENTIDHAKSAELLAELTAGAPAALILASMFQRDEHGNKKIPILLEQLKVKLTDSKQIDTKSGDRHMIFRIELEYGNGLTRMKWVIHRALRDFVNLHTRYKLQVGAQKYIKLKNEDARTKLPHFPRSAFPYLRGIRGLESDSEEEDDPDADGAGRSGGDTSGAERPGKKKKSRPALSASRRKPSVATVRGGGDTTTTTRYPERQRKKLETYLQQMIRYLIFRPESNRLCKFLELSALGVRLAAEGSYHGKEGLLIIKSGKGVDFRKAWTPALLKSRHGPKWFSVRHSYVVCVDSPEDMNIYDVFLVDSSFQIETKRKHLRNQKPKDIAKAAKESASHPQYHSLRLFNSERKMKLLAKNERQLHQFEESIRFMSSNSPWGKPKRFDSFAPVRSDVFAQWLVDGRDYMWNVSRAISMAKDVIYIHDWWLSPELYMRRPAAISQKWRLDRLLQRKAREGVKVFVIMYRNINSAIPIDSEYTKFSLLELHPNVFVQRSPNQFRQNTFFWAHHEKICIIDHMIAFVGGIDLCFGRWDTPQHTVVDDKLTGFEMSDAPKDADHCQLWPGKDYSNPRVQDFYALDKPYEEMYDRSKIPRMPWHDIHMQIVGQPARDLTRHFVQRWNYILRQRKPTRPTPFLLPPPDFNPGDLEALGLNGTSEVQILRSACSWSLGTPDHIERSILNAYIKMIEQSEHFVYIENQFFISSSEVEGTRIENQIGDALVERIVRASQKREDWRAVVVIPLMPGFQNTVDQQDGTSVRLIMQCQFRSICRGDASIFGRVRAQGIEPEDYIQFYSLRSWGKIGPAKQLVTEQLYIHAKCMVVDDRVAIIGSANINERSMLGSRDSECAAVVRDTDMLWSTMNGEPYLVGRFAHTLRMRLMREHLGIDVDQVMEEDLREEEEQHDQQWNKDMDKFHGEENLDRETEEQMVQTRNRIQDEVLHKSEKMSSFNHDANWEQADNPNLKANRKLTHDPRVTNNPEHKKDVDGEGADAMKQEENAGQAGRRDTLLVNSTKGSKELLVSPEDSNSAKGKPISPKIQESRQRSTSRLLDDGGNAALPPVQPLTRTTSAQLGLTQTSQLPALPATDDTDIGGPVLHRTPSQKANEIVNPLVADLKRPFVDKDCMRDPLNDSFFLDTWHALAENNTRLFRQVFRCMPDNEVKSWKEYKEYAAYSERFSQAQGGGKSRERAQQDAPGTSGPPGQGSVADRLRMLGAIGEKVGDVESKAETFGEKLMHSLGQKDGHNNHPMGKVEEWAEEANRAQAERQAKEAKERAENRQGSPGSDTAVDEKAPLRTSNELKPSATVDSEAIGKIPTPSSVSYSDALNRNTSTQKRRRRATTRSSRREFHASDDIMSSADAEELMHMVQGHLVTWPYDWLAKEEQGGNWLYSIDGLAPLEI